MKRSKKLFNNKCARKVLGTHSRFWWSGFCPHYRRRTVLPLVDCSNEAIDFSPETVRSAVPQQLSVVVELFPLPPSYIVFLQTALQSLKSRTLNCVLQVRSTLIVACCTTARRIDLALHDTIVLLPSPETVRTLEKGKEERQDEARMSAFRPLDVADQLAAITTVTRYRRQRTRSHVNVVRAIARSCSSEDYLSHPIWASEDPVTCERCQSDRSFMLE
ncbi:hypothetical protein J6590_049102 [Homalodisca vitripennis]|nr:hypothetical protein J6590_049102 [Homalodisca vitripennis]